jgi:hypothetical protein
MAKTATEHTTTVDKKVLTGRPEKRQRASYRNLRFPIAEQFFFKRVVFDEFHESESFGSKEVHALCNLKAVARWGLTGTPSVEDLRSRTLG